MTEPSASREWRLSKLGYRPPLDGIRAVAVLAVLAFHSGTRVRGGFLGVDVFFVLSGFLITSLLLQERLQNGSISLRAFYGRRARRLLPALILTLVAVGLIDLVRPHYAAGIGYPLSALAVAFYAGNWVEAVRPGGSLGVLLGHTWSLAVEEQFYIVWPVLLIFLLRRRSSPTRLLALLLAAALASVVLRALLWFGVSHLGPTGTDGYPRSDSRADELLVGCALAVAASSSLWRRSWAQQYLRSALPALVAGAVLLLLSFRLSIDGGAYYVGGLSLVVISAAAVIAHVVAEPTSVVSRALGWSPLTWIGERSYGIYLFHPLIFLVILPEIPLLETTGVFAFLVGSGVTILVAALSYRFVESYFLRRKRYATKPPAVRLNELGEPAIAVNTP